MIFGSFAITSLVVSALIVGLYLWYKGPNRLYKDELEIVSTTIKKVVRETIRHDRANINTWKLILGLIKKTPTSSADFTVSYLIVKLENLVLYKLRHLTPEERTVTLSKVLKIKQELKQALEIEMQRHPGICRVAIQKGLIIKSIKSILKEYS